MRFIINLYKEFIEGNASHKLSIISNITTVFGISLVTFIGSPLLSQLVNRNLNLPDFLIALSSYFILVSISILLLYYFFGYIRLIVKTKILYKILLSILYFLILCWLFITILPYYFLTVGYVFSNDYLLPQKAIYAIDSVDAFYNYNTKIISGNVRFKENSSNYDYKISVYLKSLYENKFVACQKVDSTSVSRRKEYSMITSQIHSDGYFNIDISKNAKNISAPVTWVELVVTRKSEGLLRSLEQVYDHFPNSDTDKYGAYLYRIEKISSN